MTAYSGETLAASRTVIAMVTAVHHGNADDALDIFYQTPREEIAATVLLLAICAKQGYEFAAMVDGITLDEALTVCGLLSAEVTA